MISLDPPRDGNRRLPDAIVMSGWTWETFNVPERIALAFAHLGARVLYCENPVSMFRHKACLPEEVEPGIYRARLEFLGQRLNRIPVFFPYLQSKLLATQILRSVDNLGLEAPLFVYPHGNFASLCAEFKRRGFFLVHVCMDYPEDGQERLIELSELTLNIPKSLFENLKTMYGSKIRMIPQVTRLFDSENPESEASEDSTELGGIPRPRLGYTGPADRRLDLGILHAVLSAHPEWQFVHFGLSKCLDLNNVHVLPWQRPEKLKEIVAKVDVGLMPYRRDDNKNLHCMPLKLLDYFAQGKPVVSTPIVNLLEFSDTIYFGDDADHLCQAIQLALDEPLDSPLKSKRVIIARKNSIEALANVLAQVLASNKRRSNAAA
jgi:hypothetical protein